MMQYFSAWPDGSGFHVLNDIFICTGVHVDVWAETVYIRRVEAVRSSGSGRIMCYATNILSLKCY